MKKSIVKKPLSLLLSVLMLLPVLGSLPVTSASAYSVGDLIEFGSYPQTKVTDSSLISSLNAVQKYWASYKYYRGTSNSPGSMQPFDGVLFADLWFEGVKYRALKIDQYRPTHTFYTSSSGNSEQDDRGYYTGTVYYFKYEPLIWRVLDPTDGFVICENLVDAQPLQSVIYSSGGNYYQDAGSTVYANNYATSTLRDWLNYEFYETAFTDTQKANILVHSYGNEFPSSAYNYPATDDKISLATAADVTNADYGFSENSSRSAVATDYAKSQGMYKNNQWRLRSPGTDSKSSNFLNNSGGFTEDSDVYYVGSGIRPVCYLSDLQEDTAVSENLFSAVQYNKQGYAVGDMLQFGSYPQSRVTNTTLISSLNAVQKDWASYKYYSGTGNRYDGNMQPGDGVCFADFWYDGAKYRAVKIGQYRPKYTGFVSNAENSQQDDRGYYTGTVYYFKYEPLTWRVLDPDAGYVICEKIIDSQPLQNMIYSSNGKYYQDAEFSVYANNYSTSYVRGWLNRDFYETAFTDSQKQNIVSYSYGNEFPSSAYNYPAGNDKISLPTETDVKNSAYGFTGNSSRIAYSTTYAKSQGLDQYNQWRLRSPGTNSLCANYVNEEGKFFDNSDVYYVGAGMRPVCHLSILEGDSTVEESLFSSDLHAEQGHTTEVEWTWTSGYTSATAACVCTFCGAVLDTQTDNAPGIVEITPAGCADDRVVKYTASVSFNGTQYSTETEAVTLTGTAHHTFTYTAEGAVLSAVCTAESCPLNGDPTTLTIVAPAKTVYGDENSAAATLDGLEAFNASTGLSLSEADIRYDGGSETAPVNAGDHTASLTVTIDGTDYTITTVYAITKAMPEYESPSGLTVLYGKTLADVSLPEGWAWNAPETPVGCLGDHTFTATFTPEDTDNYNDVSETLTVTVYTNYTFFPAKEPSCTRAGNTAYYYNPANRTYYIVTEDNELAEIELYTTVIPATGHVYGTEGDARFTCTVCGYVDQGRKEDAEYEDMLPFYLESFNAAKEEVKAACDGRLQEGDSAACAALVENTKRDIDNLPYDRYKTQDENKEAVYAFLSRLNTDLANQRMADHAGACPYCGGYHHGSIIGILHAMLYVLSNFFSKLFFFI